MLHSRFVYVKPALHLRDEANLIVMDQLFDVLLDLVGTSMRISMRIFASIIIMDIGLKFSFLVVSLPDFGVRIMLAS